MRLIIAILGLCSTAFGCFSIPDKFVWTEVTSTAAFPQAYNYPVFAMNGGMFAINNGGWISKDGKKWTKTRLPESGLNSGYQKYVLFGGAVYALGAMNGNYLDFNLSTKILRTADGKTWKTLAESSNLPVRIFYGALVFKNKIWLVGGFDGKRYHNDVWNSADGIHWTRVAEKTDWSPRISSALIEFKNKMWLIGGGVIDGEANENPNSNNEVWSSEDGKNWTIATSEMAKNPVFVGAYSAAVFDQKIWITGVNRSGEFQSGVLTSEDGVTWHEMSAPWSPRGGTVVWIFDDKLFMTGGKYSYSLPNGETKFVYSNDVWAMSKKTE